MVIDPPARCQIERMTAVDSRTASGTHGRRRTGSTALPARLAGPQPYQPVTTTLAWPGRIQTRSLPDTLTAYAPLTQGLEFNTSLLVDFFSSMTDSNANVWRCMLSWLERLAEDGGAAQQLEVRGVRGCQRARPRARARVCVCVCVSV
jgi:hypothetical protein